MNLLIIVVSLVYSQIPYLDRNIYQGIVSGPCTRVLNERGNVTGCSTENGGRFGMLFNIKSQLEFDQFISSDKYEKHSIVIPKTLFTPLNLQKSKESGKIAGIILVRDPTIQPYSLDSKTPLHQYGLYQKDSNPHEWNPKVPHLFTQGLDLLQEDIGLPVFEIDSFVSDNSTIALEMALKYNQDSLEYPRYALEFESFMWASKNSDACLKRGYYLLMKGFCDPIGGKSVWSTFSELSALDSKPIIMFTTKFDANSIIRDFAFGHSNRVNAIFLLGIADALSKSTTPIQGLDKSIVFSWFNSENWGYAGSQRFVEDISKEFVCKDTNPTATCPQNLGNSCSLPCHSTTAFQKLKFDRIESVIDVDIGGILHSKIDGASNIYLHVDQSNVETNKLISAFQSTIIEPGYNNSSPLNITIAAAVRPGEPNFKLPPSSSMAYLQKKTSLPAIVLTDYRTEFSNPYYNSEYDKVSEWSNQHISLLCGLATITAKSLYKLASNAEPPSSINANCSMLEENLDCLIRNASCARYQSFVGRVTGKEVNSYTGVFSFDGSRGYIADFLARSIANITSLSRLDECKNDRNCKENGLCIQGNCVQSTTHFHNAYGTGLEYNYDKNVWEVVNETKAAWVESKWAFTGIRLFKVGSPSVYVIELIISCVILMASAALAYIGMRS